MRTHQSVDEVRFRSPGQCIHPATMFSEIVTQCAQRDIESHMTSIAEAICDGLRSRSEPYFDALDLSRLDAMRECVTACADHLELRVRESRRPQETFTHL